MRKVCWALALLCFSSSALWADNFEKKAQEWINKEFTKSTLSKKAQLEELKWFIKASKPFRGMKIQVVSESIDTHSYESKVLAKAFTEITGIKL